MYAVIETGGKQYRVELGSELAIERLDVAPGDTVRFERVLLIADGDAAQIGTPLVADALVTGEVLRQDRGEKVIVFKYRPKARHRAKKGHRQEQTVVRVADISFGGRSAASEAGVEEREQAKGRKAAAAEAEKKAAADAALAEKLAADEAAREAAENAADKADATPATKSTTPKKAAPKATSAKSTTAKESTTKAPAKPATAKSPAKATAAKSTAKPKAAAPAAKKSTSAKPKADSEKD
jgi:large subunit ribosomal protein L21